MSKVISLKYSYFNALDAQSRYLARSLDRNRRITRGLLKYTQQLYQASKPDRFRDNQFEMAYHNPITSDFEFLLARLLYHYSSLKKLRWKVLLRRQVGKTAPDIRIENDSGRTLAIIEIKVKGGWIQPFLSKERFKKDMRRLRTKESKIDPRQLIRTMRRQLSKYGREFNLSRRHVFFLIPSLVMVHRKKSALSLKDYCNEFATNSGLPPRNLILLSSNMSLDLGGSGVHAYQPTDNLEGFVQELKRYSKQDRSRGA